MIAMTTLLRNCFAVALVCLCLGQQAVTAQDSRVSELIEQGDAAVERGDLRDAESRYTQAVLADRSSVNARKRLGKLKLDLGKLGDAEDQFRAALRSDPDDLEVRYYQGIVKREQGRNRPPLTGWLLDEFKDSRTHFQFVIERDSTFRDVLFQYALLQQYRGDEQAAMNLAFRQVLLKPEDPASVAGFFRLGRMYASTLGSERTGWLSSVSPDYRTLFHAEALRRVGALGSAQEELLRLLQSVGPVPRPAVHVLLARIFLAGHHVEAAEVQFWSAVDAIQNASDAAIVFEETKYVLSDDELAAYDTLSSPDAYRRFFRSVWARRDPMPAAAANARLVEHIRRLNQAEESYEHFRPRTFFNDPDVNSALDFGQVYALNQSFNDKGLIFIRHGPPDARIFTNDEEGPLSRAFDESRGPGTMEPLPVESWRYYATGGQPEMVFHFATRAGSNWRLIAAPMWLQALNDRRSWGPLYSEAFQAITNGASLEIPRLNMRMQHESQDFVDVGLQTDRHSWAENVIALQLPATVAAFRGEDRSTEVLVYYAFPTRPISETVTTEQPVPVEIGLAVLDSTWTKVVSRRDQRLVQPSASQTDVAAGVMEFSVDPGDYTISMHVRPEDTPLVGGWRSEHRFPDFSSGRFAMSDLVLATNIGPAAERSPFTRGEVNVLPSFTRRFAADQSVYVYFELYNLALDSSDHTSYSTVLELRPGEGRRRGPFGIFGSSDRPVLSLRTEGTGSVISPIEYSEIDMSDVQPGRYRLVVRVTDLVSGNVVVQEGELELVAP